MSEPSAASPAAWSIQDARTLYNIDRWGARYFDINDAGHVVALPLQNAFYIINEKGEQVYKSEGFNERLKKEIEKALTSIPVK